MQGNVNGSIAKKFFIFCIGCIIIMIFTIYSIGKFNNHIVPELISIEKEYDNVLMSQEIIYILQWTNGSHSPFHFLGKGQSIFFANNCTYTNCFVTDDRNYLRDSRYYHAVLFNGHEVIKMPKIMLPKLRNNKQKYIFSAMESADNYPACKPYLDNFFNWTWTYRLDSDVRWGYITCFDIKNSSVVGPKIDMVWPPMNSAISDVVRNKLKDKREAVAWFVSNCRTKSKRELKARELQQELRKFGLRLDIYGSCGTYKCPRNKSNECNKILERDYYFYLSFENSFASDYVTEKILTPMNHFTVPIVYGTANYSR